MGKESVPEAREIWEELASYWTGIWSWIQILLSDTALSKLPTPLSSERISYLLAKSSNHHLWSVLREAP